MPSTALTPGARKERLRRSDPSGPGATRVKHGRGFRYLDAAGTAIADTGEVSRIKELVIPPAWQDVWICADPLGHLQATGIDAAGRKQYLYHPRWRDLQDRKKYDHMLSFAALLPKLRRRVRADLDSDDGVGETRVLACAVRLLDIGLFRIGSEQYAADDGGIGLATLTKAHVTVDGGEVVFDYHGKSGVHRVQSVQDAVVAEIIGTLKRRRSGGAELLAYRVGRRWRDVRSDQISEYLKAQLGEDYSAKDFRTWSATVLAAVSLGVDGRGAASKTARRRAINGAVKGVSTVLGNTPAVARRSYIDPRVFDRYLSGWTIGAELDRIGAPTGPDDRRRTRLEAAVIDLLRDDRSSDAVARDVAAVR